MEVWPYISHNINVVILARARMSSLLVDFYVVWMCNPWIVQLWFSFRRYLYVWFSSCKTSKAFLISEFHGKIAKEISIFLFVLNFMFVCFTFIILTCLYFTCVFVYFVK